MTERKILAGADQHYWSGIADEILAFRKALRIEDQEILDQLMRTAQQNIRSMQESVDLVIPLEMALFSMLIEQEKRILRLEAKLQE